VLFRLSNELLCRKQTVHGPDSKSKFSQQKQILANSAVLPSSIQSSEAGHPEIAISHILPPISMPQTIKSVNLQSLSFTDNGKNCHILFESSGEAKFGHLSNFAETP